MVDEKHSVSDSKGPQCCIGDGRPMDCGMKHHCSGNGHYRSDVSLRNTVVVVCSHSSEVHDVLNSARLSVNSADVKALELSAKNS